MKTILLVTFSLLQLGLHAQIVQDTAVFKDGSKVPYVSYNAIDSPPRYIFNLSPLSLTFFGDNSPALGVSFGQLSRIKDKFLVDSRIFLPYSKVTDFEIKDERIQKTTMEIGSNFSYKFVQRHKTRKNHFYIAYKNSTKSGVDYNLYGIEFQMPYVTNYYITGGLNFFRAASSDYIGIIDTTYRNIALSNSSSLSVNIGITRDRYTYHVFNSKELKKVGYRYYRVRNYAYLTYAPYLNYSVMGEIWHGEIPETGPYQELESGYVVPTSFRRLGWRFGAELKMTNHHAHNGLYLGIEIGRTHGIKVEAYEDVYSRKHGAYYSGSIYTTMKVGYEFGIKNHLAPKYLMNPN